MHTNKVETCTCLQYIGDSGHCPVHDVMHSTWLQKLKRALGYRRATSTMRLDRRDDNTYSQEEADRLAEAVYLCERRQVKSAKK